MAISRACVDYINDIDKKSVSTIKGNTPLVKADTMHEPSNTIDRIIYMVQVTTSLKKIVIKPDNFNNIKDIIEISSGSRFRYATGSFSEYNKAVSYRKQIQEIYPDAFVIAVKDNKILPLLELLEKNKGK
jgi:N-acetylmuramoyl-L-alanine amidase